MDKKKLILILLIVLVLSSAGYIWFGIIAYETYNLVVNTPYQWPVKYNFSNLGIIGVCTIGLITNTIFGLLAYYIAIDRLEINNRLKELEKKQSSK